MARKGSNKAAKTEEVVMDVNGEVVVDVEVTTKEEILESAEDTGIHVDLLDGTTLAEVVGVIEDRQEPDGMGFKLLRSDAIFPERRDPEDAARSLHTVESFRLMPGVLKKFRTGVAPVLKPGYYYNIFPRSGMACNDGITIINCVPVIDSGFTGEMIIGLYNTSRSTYVIEKGDAIAQIMLQKILDEEYELKEFKDTRVTERGGKGLGSTGR